MSEPDRRSWVRLAFWVTISAMPGALGVAFMPDEWYRHLVKPWWTPPDAVFGPIWMILYGLIGVATYRVASRDEHPETPAALTRFFAQVVLNALWSPLFFGLHRPDLALVTIVGLWFVIVAMIRSYSRVRRGSALLLGPYLAWVTFAAALNASIWILNR